MTVWYLMIFFVLCLVRHLQRQAERTTTSKKSWPRWKWVQLSCIQVLKQQCHETLTCLAICCWKNSATSCKPSCLPTRRGRFFSQTRRRLWSEKRCVWLPLYMTCFRMHAQSCSHGHRIVYAEHRIAVLVDWFVLWCLRAVYTTTRSTLPWSSNLYIM